VNPKISNLLSDIRKLPAALAENYGSEWRGHSELKMQAEALAMRVDEGIRKAATAFQRDVVLVVKNLIAECPVSDFDQIRTLLAFWTLQTEGKLKKDFSELAVFLSQHSSRKNDFFHWALHGGRSPTLSAAHDFFGNELSLMLGFHREVKLKERTPTQLETCRIICFLSQRETIYPGEKVRDVLLREGFEKGLQPLEQPYFEKLPKQIRCWFLADDRLRAAALEASFRARIVASPLDFPETPEALDKKDLHEVIVPGALSAFSERNFHSSHIQLLLQRPELETFSQKILEAIRWKQKSPTRMDPHPVLALPEKLPIKSAKDLKNALLFYSKHLPSRLEWLLDLPVADGVQVEQNLPSEDIHAALLACTSRSLLENYRKLFAESLPSQYELPRLLKSKDASREFVEIFARDLFIGAEKDEMLSLFDAKPNCLAGADSSCLSARPFQRFVLECASSSARFSRFIKNAPAPLLESLLGGKAEIFEEFQGALSKTLDSRGSAPLRQSLRQTMLELAPDFIGNFLGWGIAKTEFAELIGLRIKAKSRFPATALLHFVFEGGLPAWEFFLDDRKCKRLLKPLIRQHRPDLIQRLDQLEAETLLKSTDFQAKLLNHLSTSSHVPMGLSIGVRWELIPWIREKFANKPTLCIAYQLALAFSIKDAGYLTKLCFDRWASPLRKNPGHVFDHLYALHKIPKKSGGFREIHAPCAELKRLQSRILENGFNRVPMSRSAHGFHRKRSILTNAIPHSGKACVVNVDIDSFFPSTKHNRILQAAAHLANRHLSYGARQVLADLLSHDGALPTGAPTSPAIGNLVLRGADAAIAKVAARHGIDYTRYADDLTFSGHKHAVKILPFVEKVLGQLGYKLNAKKTNIYRRGRRQMVTGLVVNEKPNLPRHVRRRLRAAVHTAAKGENPHWNGHPMNKHELGGRISLLNLVDQHKAAALREKLGKATETSTNQ
jgi:retron-type reverse transcriptase